MRLPIRGMLAACLVVLSQLEGHTQNQAVPRAGSAGPQNILFIMLDDVGKDQLAIFNPSAGTAALTPNINAIAAAGVKFTHLDTMPECSPSRAAFFTGRSPLRTGVTAAILDQDLAAAQVSPSETTTPRVLATAGYRSALIGKYHLGGPENNPAGNGAPLALGWDYFDGNLRGGPPSIDVSLGGQYTRDTKKYSCGFPTGAARGAVWFPSSSGQAQCDDNRGAGYTGQQGVALGGIAALDADGELAPTCNKAAGAAPDFTTANGYYVWPKAVADSGGLQTLRSRRYMTTDQTDAAVAWIRAQSTGRVLHHWMATVSYNAIHTPYQQPPLDLYPPGFVWPANIPENCTDPASQRVLSDLMLAAMDRDIGRLLVSVGLAQRDASGGLLYEPETTNTMVVIVGDNGTLSTSVKSPYDASRSKGTAYETGVTAPMIVSGPLVAGRGRSVEHMVNAVDLFQLFGEIARVDVRRVVPPSHALDAEPVLAYLTNPNQPAARRYNFTQIGNGLKPPSVKQWPCVQHVGSINIANDILFTSAGPCVDLGATWFGPTVDQPIPIYPTACDIKDARLYSNLLITPTRVWALRNNRYKLVKVDRPSCDRGLGEFEFYDLSPNPPSNPIGLDLATAELLTNGQPTFLGPEQMTNFTDLKARLQGLLDSELVCYGDGNLDKHVDAADLAGVTRYSGQPSVFDFNQDGVTNNDDAMCVSRNFGNDCSLRGPGTPCR
ncbi:MAG: sulfatase-like hydrolase/transferase [Acidobacteriota bacterium]